MIQIFSKIWKWGMLLFWSGFVLGMTYQILRILTLAFEFDIPTLTLTFVIVLPFFRDFKEYMKKENI